LKRTAIILLILIFSNSVNAQFGENHAIYGHSEFTLGNYIGGDLGLNYIYKERYSFKFGYSGNVRSSQLKPEDYDAGQRGLLSFGIIGPKDYMENYQFCFGKIVKFQENGKTRLNLALGIGLTTIKEPGNFEFIENAGRSENYNWNYNRYNTVSLIINPKIEFPFARYYGFSISPMLQINKDNVLFVVGFGQIIGLLRKKQASSEN